MKNTRKMNNERKPRFLTFSEKVQIIEAAKSGWRKADIMKKWEIKDSTLSSILKNQETIINRKKLGLNMNRKFDRKTKFSDVEECLLKWSEKKRDHNVIINESMLKKKANFYARLLGKNNFNASNTWLNNFKKKYGIVDLKPGVENATNKNNNDIHYKWKCDLKNLIKDYEPRNIFNAASFILLYTLMPNSEESRKEKFSRDKFKILLSTNASGTEKLKLLLLSRQKFPKSFVGVKSLPLDYIGIKSNNFMYELFTNWVHKLDDVMYKENRKILLFTAESVASRITISLRSVRIIIIPSDLTSEFQPMDQGIIQNLKSSYKREAIKCMISNTGVSRNDSISVLQAIRMVDKSWRNIPKDLIVNCFNACGFYAEMELDENSKPTNVKENMKLQWCKFESQYGIKDVTFADFVRCDEEFPDKKKLNDLEESFVTESVSLEQARSSLNMLRTYMERSDDIGENIFAALTTLEEVIDKHSNCLIE